jgi:hypothetical protein
MTMMMIGMFESFQNSQNAIARTIMEQSKSHATMMEHKRKEMEIWLEQHWQDMAQCMDQQRMDMAAFTERSMSLVINQVP